MEPELHLKIQFLQRSKLFGTAVQISQLMKYWELLSFFYPKISTKKFAVWAKCILRNVKVRSAL